MRIYRISQSFVAYHGTCREIYREVVETGGLRNVYLAKNPDLAKYYASEVDGELGGGGPIVLEVIVPALNRLQYDANSMDEPVMASEDQVQEAWDKAAQVHPEWIKNDMVIIPSSEWEISWDAVGAAFYSGSIPLNHVTVYE